MAHIVAVHMNPAEILCVYTWDETLCGRITDTSRTGVAVLKMESGLGFGLQINVVLLHLCEKSVEAPSAPRVRSKNTPFQLSNLQCGNQSIKQTDNNSRCEEPCDSWWPNTHDHCPRKTQAQHGELNSNGITSTLLVIRLLLCWTTSVARKPNGYTLDIKSPEANRPKMSEWRVSGSHARYTSFWNEPMKGIHSNQIEYQTTHTCVDASERISLLNRKMNSPSTDDVRSN